MGLDKYQGRVWVLRRFANKPGVIPHHAWHGNHAGAVITLMSIGQGAQAAVQEQFRPGNESVSSSRGDDEPGGVKVQAGSADS